MQISFTRIRKKLYQLKFPTNLIPNILLGSFVERKHVQIYVYMRQKNKMNKVYEKIQNVPKNLDIQSNIHIHVRLFKNLLLFFLSSLDLKIYHVQGGEIVRADIWDGVSHS